MSAEDLSTCGESLAALTSVFVLGAVKGLGACIKLVMSLELITVGVCLNSLEAVAN